MSAVPKIPCEWETHWKKNPVQAYISTVKSVITKPVSYFGEIKPFDDFVSLAAFVYINSFIAMFFSLIFQSLFTGLHTGGMALAPFVLCWMVFLPVVAVGFAFMIGAILHLCFDWIGGSQKSFETTMTVYGLGMATRLFAIVPFVGGLAGMVYALIINIWGQAEAHEISPGKAAIAALTPMFICCCLIFGSVFVLALVLGGMGALIENIKSVIH